MKRTNTTSPDKEIEGKILPKSEESWVRITRLEFVVQQLVKDYERMDSRIDEISKTQSKITHLIQNTRMVVYGGFAAILLQMPEFISYLPTLFRLISAP